MLRCDQLLENYVNHNMSVETKGKTQVSYTLGLQPCDKAAMLGVNHPRRPRGSQLGREKRRDESLQVRAEEPLDTDPHRTISKNSSGCRLLIGHKKCFVLLCPIGEQFLLSSFRESVHEAIVSTHLPGLFTKLVRTIKGNFHFLLS